MILPINLDRYCTRCDSDEYVEERPFSGLLFCTLCWDHQRPIGGTLRRYIDSLAAPKPV